MPIINQLSLVGRRVVFIGNNGAEVDDLTIGKIYTLDQKSNGDLFIIDDIGDDNFVPNSYGDGDLVLIVE